MKIAIEGIKIKAYHGVYEEERKKGTYFVVDVYMEVADESAGVSDDLSHTVDYQTIYNGVIALLNQPVKLLETLAAQIADHILSNHLRVERASVKVSKLRPLRMEHCERTYIELVRERATRE